MLSRYAICFGFALFVFVVVGCESNEPKKGITASPNQPTTLIQRPAADLDPTDARIFETNFSEEWVLAVTPKFRLLSKHLIGEQADLSPLFHTNFDYQGLASFDLEQALTEHQKNSQDVIQHLAWPIEKNIQPIESVNFWHPLTKDYRFEDTQFGVTRVQTDATIDRFQMDSVFEGRFRDSQQRLFGVKAKQTIDWVPADDSDWKIGAWRQTEFEIVAASQSLFTDVTKQLFPDQKTLEALTRSLHEELILKLFQTGTGNLVADSRHPLFSDWESTYQYSAVSVTDFDGDGWEDLFVTDRSGQSLLLRNQQGEKFENVTESSGLIVNEFANGAIFADFDNDGDPDVLVLRTVEPCLFFENNEGKFFADAAINADLTEVKFVVAGSVVDVNRDGLLDVYLSTYCFPGGDPEKWIAEVAPINDQLPMRMSVEKQHPYLDRGGPPNVLLMNRGGKLERVEIDRTLKQFRNSFQSAWFDQDDDGDADLYICNDYAPDVFLRNDTPRGSFEPKFSDITAKILPDKNMGFGMGISLADYNMDGRLDMYVSNMYSKAGLRIAEQIGGEVDPRILVSAKGNFLYENKGSEFQQVAGVSDETQKVAKVGWSFGGQWADLNNDCELDLYVPSGLFSVPAEINSQVDL